MRMYVRSKSAVALLGGGVLVILALIYLFVQSTSGLRLDPEIKAARELLDSWGGQPQTLVQAQEKIAGVLSRNPNDYFAMKEAARYTVMAGYIRGRNVSYQHNVYVVGEFSPGTLEQAEALIRKAVSINPRFAEGYVFLGYIQFQQSKLDMASITLDQAEQIGTDDPWLHLNMADIDNARGKFSDANNRAERVLASGTSNSNAIFAAYDHLIEGYSRTGQYEKAAHLFEKKIQQKPNDAWLHGNFASFLTNTLGRNDEAIKQARVALQLMSYGIGERVLATALYRKWADLVAQGNIKDGEKYFQEAYGIFPDLNWIMAYAASDISGATGNLAKSLSTDKGVSIDARAEDGSTALLIATNRNRAQTVRALLDLNANPNIADNNGWTPLISAADEGNSEIVNLLLSKGADVHVKLDNKDAAFFAEQRGDFDLASMLRKRATRLK